jgi:hypothetical protein
MQIGTVRAGDRDVPVQIGTYADGKFCVMLGTYYDRYGMLSINTDDELGATEFVINHDMREPVLGRVLDMGTFEDTGKRVDYGYVKGQAVWQLTIEHAEAWAKARPEDKEWI